MHITKNKGRRGADNMWIKYVSVKGHQRNQKAVALRPEYIRLNIRLNHRLLGPPAEPQMQQVWAEPKNSHN